MPVAIIVIPLFFLLWLLEQQSKKKPAVGPAEPVPALPVEQLLRIRQACASARHRTHSGEASLTQEERDRQQLLDEVDRLSIAAAAHSPKKTK